MLLKGITSSGWFASTYAGAISTTKVVHELVLNGTVVSLLRRGWSWRLSCRLVCLPSYIVYTLRVPLLRTATTHRLIAKCLILV